MPLAAPVPGATLVFTATPQPAGSALPAGAPPPTWSSSDTANVSLTPNGLTVTAVLSTSIPVGESVTISISDSYTSANGNGAITAAGSVSFTVEAPVAPDVTSFLVAQTA